MEDKKNVAKLDDEQLEQVAGGSGGWGDRPYTECHIYQYLLRIKNEKTLENFKDHLRLDLYENCPAFEYDYYCADCPVRNEWLDL